MAAKVYVGGLGNSGDKQELWRTFSKFGVLRDVWVARNPPGFAFVEYEDIRDAEDAVKGMDGKRLGDNKLRVEISKTRNRGGSRGGGRGGGRSGGRDGGGRDGGGRDGGGRDGGYRDGGYRDGGSRFDRREDFRRDDDYGGRSYSDQRFSQPRRRYECLLAVALLAVKIQINFM